MASLPVKVPQTLRLRAGPYGVTFLVLSVLFLLPGLLLLAGGGTVVVTSRGWDLAWGIIGLLLVLGFDLLMAVLLVSSVDALRPVLVRPGADGWASGEVSLPRSGLRTGFTRRAIALADVRSVDLVLHRTPRVSWWQLVLHTRDERVTCNSITSTASERRLPETTGYAAMQQLRRCVAEGQGARAPHDQPSRKTLARRDSRTGSRDRRRRSR